MTETFPYSKRSHYPHMKPADIAIWERFIDQNPTAYKSVQYDYLVGAPPPFDPTVNAATGGEVSDLYRKKIDVVGFTNSDIHIIEVKPNAGPSAIGQVKGYAALYRRDEHPILPVHSVIITDVLRPDLEFIAAEEHIILIVIKP